MAKLSKFNRTKAQKDLLNGMKISQVAKKYGITPSACHYLKQQAEGSSPGVEVFENEFNAQQRARFKHLLAKGCTLTQLANDYETPRSVLKAYCNKYKLSYT
jgi:uncharacterized protein YjcR